MTRTTIAYAWDLILSYVAPDGPGRNALELADRSALVDSILSAAWKAADGFGRDYLGPWDWSHFRDSSETGTLRTAAAILRALNTAKVMAVTGLVQS